MGTKLSKYGKAALTLTALGVTTFTGMPAIPILGLSKEVMESFKDIFQDVQSNILAEQLIKAAEKDDDLEKAYEAALIKTLEAVKNDFYVDKKLQETFSLKLKAKLEGIPSEKIVNRNSMEEKFFNPLEEVLIDNERIKSIFEENKQLELGNLVQQIIREDSTISFPSFINTAEKKNQVIEIFSNLFNKRFLENFKKQLTKNKKAKTAYHTHLLHSSFSLLDTLEERQEVIREQVTRLLHFAKYQNYDLDKLLAGNNRIQELQKKTQKDVAGIKKKLEDSSKPLLKLYTKQKTDRRDQISYQSLYSDFVGRDEELDLLRGFLEKDQQICWYMIEGAGGAGKSRLTNELCIKAKEINWMAGFYSFEHNENFKWNDFEPSQNTLIVFDYVRSQNTITHVKNILDLLTIKGDTYSHKIRVVLIDRNFDDKALAELNTVSTRDKYYTYTSNKKNEPYELVKLEYEARWTIMFQMFAGNEKEQEFLENKELLMRYLNQQDPLKRPLFALFTGIALDEGENISDWNTNDNLKYHIKRQEKKFWSQNFLWKEGFEDSIKNIIWFATICVYLTPDDIEQIKEESSKIIHFKITDKTFEHINELFQSMDNSMQDQQIIYQGIKPDLLAEFFILNHLKEISQKPGSWNRKLPHKLQEIAWSIRPIKVGWMTYLTTTNFYEDNDFKLIERFIDTYQDGTYFGRFLNNFANVYSDKGDINKAKQYYHKAIDNGIVESLNNLAVLYNKQGKFEKAEQYYLKSVEQNQVDAIYNLAKMYREKGDLTEAKQYFRQAIEQGDVDALNELGNLFREKGDLNMEKGVLKKAKHYYNKAEQLYLQAIDQGHIDALTNLASLYQKQGNIPQSKLYYQKGIDKGVVAALNGLGVLYYEQGDFENAEQYYLKAIEQDNVNALNNLAYLYAEQDRTNEAEEYYLQAIDQGHIKALVNLAFLYYKQGNTPKTMHYFTKAIDQGITEAINYLGKLYQEDGDLDKAEEYYLQAIDTGDFKALSDLVNLFLEQGRPEEALKYLNKAIEAGYKPAYFTKALMFYQINISNKEFALKLIDESGEKWGLTLKEKAFKVILLLWSGDLEKYERSRDEVLNQIVDDAPNLIEIFITDLLTHFQQDWLMSKLRDETLATKIKQNAELEYYLIHHFANSEDKILGETTYEMQEKLKNAIEHINSKREFYSDD